MKQLLKNRFILTAFRNIYFKRIIMGLIKEVTDAEFSAAIANGLTMVDFWAPWCAPCRMVAPVLEDLQKEMGDSISIIKINVDENPATAQSYGITSIPTLLLFKDGQLVDRAVGAGPKDFYKKRIEKYL